MTAAGGGSAAAADWTITPGVGASLTFSDNIDLEPDGQRTQALIASVAPNVSVSAVGPRLNGVYSLTLDNRYQTAGDDEGVSVFPRFSGVGSAELWEDRFFVDTRSSVSRVLLNNQDADSDTNRNLVQSYSVSPRYVQRFGDLATLSVIGTYEQLIVDSDANDEDDVSDTSSTSLRVALNGGTQSRRFRWSVNTSGSIASSSNDDDAVQRRSVTLDTEYFVIRSLSLLGTVGYQQFDDGNDGNDINSVILEGGVHWQPGRRTDLRLTYGHRDDRQSFRGDLSYQLGARTVIRASYDEVLVTGEEQFSNDLQFAVQDPDSGLLIDSRTGLPFQADANPTTSDSDTSIARTFRASLIGSTGRNQYSLSTVYQNIEQEGGGDEETVTTVSSSVSRNLSPRASASVDASYSHSDFSDIGREDDQFSAGARYNYNVFTNVNAFSSYQFRTRLSNLEAEEFTENRLVVGFNMLF